jgi:flagellar hook protein FlgE
MGFSSFQLAVSGMKANQESMAVIGNNIANVDTDGFKGVRYQFKDILSQEINSPSSQTIGVNEVGMGVTGETNNLMEQGALTPGASDKDMAIDGDGFFIVANGASTEYTRVGNFRPNELGGDIVLSDNATGYTLQGWNASYPFTNEAPTIDTTIAPKNIEIGLGTFTRGRASNFVNIQGNLNASEEISDDQNSLTTFPLTSAGSLITGTTNLNAIADPSNPSNNLFPDISTQNGTITINAFKGNSKIQETFQYGQDGTTVDDFMTWAENALGISLPTTAGAIFTPGGISINNGQLTVLSGTGANQTIRNISLSYKNDTETKNILDFSESLPSNNTPKTSTGIKVIDEDGVEHTLDLTFTKSEIETDGTTWSFNIESSENFQARGTRLIDSGTIKFDLDGKQVSFSPNLVTFNYKDSSGTSKSQTLNLDLSKITQLSSSNGSDISTTQDGFAKGTLVDYYIADGGVIMGVYDNNNTEEIGKVALASFMNSENLVRTGSGNWRVYDNNQEVTIGESGTGKIGNVRAKFTEQSNVDLTTEFGKLIIAQRSFQSASNALQVSNEILKSLSSLGA